MISVANSSAIPSVSAPATAAIGLAIPPSMAAVNTGNRYVHPICGSTLASSPTSTPDSATKIPEISHTQATTRERLIPRTAARSGLSRNRPHHAAQPCEAENDPYRRKRGNHRYQDRKLFVIDTDVTQANGSGDSHVIRARGIAGEEANGIFQRNGNAHGSNEKRHARAIA